MKLLRIFTKNIQEQFLGTLSCWYVIERKADATNTTLKNNFCSTVELIH